MRMNFAGTLARLANETITVERPGATSYDEHGIANTESGATTGGRALVQPISSGNDLLLLPEGSRPHEACAIIAPFPVLEGDLVTVPGQGRFKVLAAENWQGIAGFTRAVCLLEVAS